MAEIVASDSRKKKSSFSKSINRRSTRVDLTPMVDLGFLLITFFVFTTSMAEPKAMDLIEPHDGEPIKLKQSHVMTIILSTNHTIFYYYGLLDSNNAEKQVKQTDFHNIRNLIVDKKRSSDPHYLMYIIKADKESTFEDNIKLLDEMLICDIPNGHYVEVDLTSEELDLISMSRNE